MNNKILESSKLKGEFDLLSTKMLTFENGNNMELMKLKTIVVDNIEKITDLNEKIASMEKLIKNFSDSNEKLKKKQST